MFFRCKGNGFEEAHWHVIRGRPLRLQTSLLSINSASSREHEHSESLTSSGTMAVSRSRRFDIQAETRPSVCKSRRPWLRCHVISTSWTAWCCYHNGTIWYITASEHRLFNEHTTGDEQNRKRWNTVRTVLFILWSTNLSKSTLHRHLYAVGSWHGFSIMLSPHFDMNINLHNALQHFSWMTAIT